MKKQGLFRSTSFLATLFFIVVLIVLVNVLTHLIFKRFDFTQEGRYSLSNPTKQTIKRLDDLMFVKIYLDGNLPAEFEKLKQETKDLLDEMAVYSNGNLRYEFIDLSVHTDVKKQNQIYDQLLEKGLEYTDLNVQKVGEQSSKIVWPCALVSYNEHEIAVNMLKNKIGIAPSAMINNSIQQLEYSFASAMKALQTQQKDHIAFIEGHGELDAMQVADISNALKAQYEVSRVKIGGDINALRLYKAIVIADPDSSFTEADKFIIDQFIMRGGSVLWLIDPVQVELDSLRKNAFSMGISRSLNLEDQLFTYGVRLNSNLLLDMHALPMPIVTGQVAGRPKQEFMPWFYAPLLFSKQEDHALVKNLEAIKTEFISNIDTIGVKSVKKSILLKTSQYTKLQTTPARISFNILRVPPSAAQFNLSDVPVAVLLEGNFQSVFKNRVVPKNDQGAAYKIRDTSFHAKQIVIADGDIIRNQLNADRTKYAKLGYDRYTNKTYGNKDFLLNCINYLCGDEQLIGARAKSFKIRLLDHKKIEQQKTLTQFVVIFCPLLLVLVFGLLQLYLRKRKYAY